MGSHVSLGPEIWPFWGGLVCVAQCSCSDDVAWFHPIFFEKFAIYWFLEVSGGLTEISRGRKRAKNTQKWISPVVGAVLGETPADQI